MEAGIARISEEQKVKDPVISENKVRVSMRREETRIKIQSNLEAKALLISDEIAR